MHELFLDFHLPSERAKCVVVVFEFWAGISILLEYRAFLPFREGYRPVSPRDLDIIKRRSVELVRANVGLQSPRQRQNCSLNYKKRSL
jgi:hypothetical protein